jgi:hypothetical protein
MEMSYVTLLGLVFALLFAAIVAVLFYRAYWLNWQCPTCHKHFVGILNNYQGLCWDCYCYDVQVKGEPD